MAITGRGASRHAPLLLLSGWTLVLVCGSSVAFTGCASEDTERALNAMAEARQKLAASPVREASGPAGELIEITRRAIEEASDLGVRILIEASDGILPAELEVNYRRRGRC